MEAKDKICGKCGDKIVPCVECGRDYCLSCGHLDGGVEGNPFQCPEGMKKAVEKEAKESAEKKKEHELSRQLLSEKRVCPKLDRDCLKEMCEWYDVPNERCIIVSMANILAGNRIRR